MTQPKERGSNQCSHRILRKKVDKLWDRFWSAGITNPLVAVEQITYLLFLKRLESVDVKRQKSGLKSVYATRNGEMCRWSYIRQEKTDVKHLIEVVFPWLRELETSARPAEQQRHGAGRRRQPNGRCVFPARPQ